VYANRDGEVLECGGSKAGILRLTKAEAEELVSEMWLELTKWNAEIDVTLRAEAVWRESRQQNAEPGSAESTSVQKQSNWQST
jgi:hypothetical protein